MQVGQKAAGPSRQPSPVLVLGHCVVDDVHVGQLARFHRPSREEESLREVDTHVERPEDRSAVPGYDAVIDLTSAGYVSKDRNGRRNR